MVKQTKTLILFLLVFIFLIVGVKGLAFESGKSADIKHPVRFEGGIPTNSMLCNVSVYYPNNSLLIDFKQMTNQVNYFNYTLNENQTSKKGDYSYCVTCSQSGINQTECFDYTINLGGINPSQIRTDASSRTIYIFFGLAVFCLAGFFLSRKLPVRITLFLLMFWFLLIGINTAYILMQDEIINSNIESFFSFFLTISFYLNYFIFFGIIVLWMVTFFINFRDGVTSKKQEDNY